MTEAVLFPSSTVQPLVVLSTLVFIAFLKEEIQEHVAKKKGETSDCG